MVFNEDPIPLSLLDSWVKPEGLRYVFPTAKSPSNHLTLPREKERSLSKLKRMHILTEKSGLLTMDPTFRESMRLALTGGGNHRSFGIPALTEDPNREVVDIPFLDNHATKQWETMLHYMVGTKSNDKPSDGVVSLLVSSGLMERR